MKTLITRIKRLALALCFVTPLVSWADAITAVNPVTGETETYSYKFIGTDTWNGTEYWQDSDGNNPSAVPAKSGDNTWEPILFDGNTININASMSVEGWNLRMGLYNGANVTMNNLVKYQGDTTMWMTVDENSQLTIGGFGEGNITANQVIKLSVAKANGITWTANLTSGNANNTFEYYLAGEGSVSYQGVTAANHKIKQADVALSGNEKSVQSKTLVSFTSTDKTFTADAAIKIKDGDDVLKTVYLTSVTADATTLTTDSDVGTCELVQTSTGIVLYYVDGDPADVVVEEKTYKPSININFTNGAGNGLTTGADVGLSGYEVPGTSWNNYVVANSTFSTVNAIDSTGAASAMSGVSVTISNVSGSWSCSGLTASSDFRQSYIDESAAKSTPTVTVTGIPYYKYRVLVYHSTDTANVPFGYDTINGTNYTYVEDALSEGTTAWGNSGAKDSADAIAEGGNVLVTEALSGSTLTVVGHRAGGNSSARGCIAAIQIIEVKADVGENDLEIPVSGDTQYTVEETKELSGTVYLTGSGTLTLAGENKISAATIEISEGVTLVVNADRLDGTTFTGAGTVVYDGTVPVEGKGWTASDWSGTVWIKNQAVSSFESAKFGNAGSTVRFTGVTGFLQTSSWNSSTYVHTVPLELVDEGNTVAFTYNNGWGGNLVKINTLKGTGTLKTQGSGAGEHIYIVDASGFTGVFNLTAKSVYVGGDAPAYSDATGQSGKLEIRSGVTMTVPSGKTWTANGGFVVNGTLNVDGTLASSHETEAVSGAGMVSFLAVPSPTGDAWWKNAAWTGTVEIYGVSTLNGNYNFNDYGNSGSTLKLTNCSGWLKPNYTCVPAIEIGGTFTWNDGSSGLNNTFKVATLKGSGTISIPNQGAATAVWQITDDWSGFTGPVIGNNGAAKRVLVFGSTLPATATAGVIYVSEGATLDLDNSSGAWWGVGMGFVVDGTVKASARNKWGGGTYMTLGDTGVLEFVSTTNTNDENTEMNNITGTGTLKFSSSAGWRAFPNTDANMPATTLTIQTELADSLILPTKFNGETVIGNLAGSKNVRSDWTNNGENGRILTVTQSKDTEWQGKFVSNRITQFNVVAPTEGTPGTLTLSGAQDATIPMQVDGSVNLTGIWKGATTVAGTIGGTGTLTGDLTFSDGATFKAFAADEDGLAVSGTVTCPEEGTVTVDVSALTPETDVALLKAADLDATKFALAEGAPEGATLEVVEGVLTLKLPVPTTVEITIPSVAGATATVTADGQPVDIADGKVTVDIGAAVVVTYTANSGYVVTGDPIAFTASAETTTVDVSGISADVILATITSADGETVTPYTSVATAFTSVDDDETLTLTANYTLTENVEITKSFTLAGSDAVTVSAGGFHFVVTDDAEFTIADSVTVGAQVWIASMTCTVKVPSTASTMVRNDTSLPMTQGYMLRYSTNEGVTTYWVIQQFVLNVNYSNCAAFLDAEHQTLLGYTPVNDGSTIQFVVVPNEGYESPTVTANDTPVEPDGEGWYSVTVDGENVTLVISATALPEITSITWDGTRTPTSMFGGYNPIYVDPRVTPLSAKAYVGIKSYKRTGASTATPWSDAEAEGVTVEYTLAPEDAAIATISGDEITFTAVGKVTVTATLTEGSGAQFVKTVSMTCANAVAEIGGTTYGTLSDALKAAGDISPSAVVSLIGEGAYISGTVSKGNVTLDLAGYTVTDNNSTANTMAINVTGGKLTVVNTGNAGGIETARAVTAAKPVFKVTNGELVLGAGLTVTANDDRIIAYVNPTKAANAATVTVDGATLQKTGTPTCAAIQGLGTDSGTVTVNIVSGQVSTTGAVAIYCPAQRTTVNVTGGAISGKTGLYVKNGTLNISGGTIHGTGNRSAYKYNGSGCSATGDALVVDNCGYPGGSATVSVTGGTFTSVNAASVASYAKCDDPDYATVTDYTPVTGFITGGTFDSDPSAYVASGYAATESAGVWTVAEVQDVPVEPGKSTEPVDSEEEAQAIAEKTVVSVPDAVADELTPAQAADYAELFEAKVVEVPGETPKYAVEVVLKESVAATIQSEVDAEAEDLAKAAVDAAADAVAGGAATVTTKPGLYYVVEAGSELDGIAPASCTLATSESTALPVPNKGAKGFYKIRVSVTPVDVQ